MLRIVLMTSQYTLDPDHFSISYPVQIIPKSGSTKSPLFDSSSYPRVFDRIQWQRNHFWISARIYPIWIIYGVLEIAVIRTIQKSKVHETSVIRNTQISEDFRSHPIYSLKTFLVGCITYPTLSSPQITRKWIYIFKLDEIQKRSASLNEALRQFNAPRWNKAF